MKTDERPRIRDHAVLFPLTVPNSLLWLALTALAYAGNAANLSLSANLEFLFGSIPVLVMLHFFGWAPALVSGFVAAAHTAILWQNPLGVVVFTMEILVVGLLYRRKSTNLLLVDTAYWVVLGMPFLFLANRFLDIGIPSTGVLTALRLAVNGIINALLASLAITLVENVVPRLRHAPSRKTVGFAQIVFLVMVTFVLIPGMVILVFTARQEMMRVEEDVQTRLEITAFSARQATNSWLSENLQTLRSLASFAGQVGLAELDEIQSEMHLLNMSDGDFTVLAVADTSGAAVVIEPAEQGTRLFNNLSLGPVNHFPRMMTDLRGVVTDAIASGEMVGRPVVLLGMPVISDGEVTGAVIGVIDTLRLQDLLTTVSSNWAVNVAIADGNGVVVASTDRAVPPFSRYENAYPGPYRELPSGMAIRTASGTPDTRLAKRWEYTEFSVRDRLAMATSWTISLHAAIAPYQSSLNERYRSVFVVMIIVIVFTTLLSAIVSRKMLQSLTDLTEVAEDLPDKVVRREETRWPVSRIAEIQTLIHCFRLTSEHLAESFTRLQETNTELTTANEEAELANRTKSEFLANISHDLRTPLNGILGFAQILSRDTSLDEQTLSAVEIIRKSGNHLLNLINDILDVSRIEADKLHLDREPFFLGSFLDDIADIVSLQSRQKGLQLVVDFDSELPTVVLGDEKRLRQVLLNLLNNAVKFTDTGEVVFQARATEGRLIALVRDTGIGIPEDELEAIFSPFKQLTKHIQSEEGTGLGLAIVSRLAKMMDGTVTVSSTAGEGSVFTLNVALPATDTVPPGPHSASTITGYTGRVQSVLVVDDKDQNRSVLRGMLEPLGFVIREASDGKLAIEAMQHEKPDIVLMDLVMPNMDGFSAIAAIRSDPNNAETPVVAISASVATSVRQECLRLGFSDFIPKPFRETDMLTIVGRLLNLEWIHRREAAPEQTEGGAIRRPSADELNALQEQVQSGNVRGIVDAADDLAGWNEEYREFSRIVAGMAQAFEIDRLVEFLRKVHDEENLDE